ncbi:PAS domain-containing protein [Hymenobacter sp. GOD-10R]|uniref:PAS domain-containing protein n=1 Tax=Hymenobacter sp. GOD-10R TaxID=3093922 RepID=UPI002D779D15|nr:PAS domain-containing protein [Hymenobacter sp. GOD-10R]WRQ30839.1 PAS domain-containing protein [Hymenobacter sp. GOD-10R]
MTSPLPDPSTDPSAQPPLAFPSAWSLPGVVASLPVACVLLTPTLHVAAASDAYLAVFGLTRTQLLGRTLFEVFPGSPGTPEGDTITSLRASLQQVLATGEPHHMAVQHYNVPNPAAPGQFMGRYWDPTNTAIRDAQGAVTGLVHSIVNVTERVQAQQQRDEQQRLVETVFAEAPTAIWVAKGPEYVFELVNPLMARILGHSPAELLGRPHFEALPELVSQGGPALHARAWQGEVVSIQDLPAHFTHQAEGELSYFSFVIQPLRDAQGQVERLACVGVEVTDQVRARQQVQLLNQELATMNKELRASNEQYQTANTALSEAQQQLRQLNEALESRVQQRTQELEASHQAAAALQAELLAAAQRQVQQREDLYQVFEQTAAVVLLLREPDHRVEYANPTSEHLMGTRLLRGRPLRECLPEAQEQGFLALLDGVYQTGETFIGNELPFTVQDADQPPRTIYFSFSYQAYREQGRIVGVSGFGYDVTQQVVARQQREEQQRLVETVFAQGATAIWVARGPAYVVELVNPLMAQMLGRSPAELLGRPYFEVMAELVDQGAPALLNRAWQGEDVFVQDLPVQFAHREELCYFSLTIRPLRDAQGQVERLAGVGVEVTDQVRARQQVQGLNEQLADLNEELAAINEELTATNEELHESNTRLVRTNADLDNFVYTASHDLKSPISNIEGLLTLLPELLPTAVLTDAHVAPLLARMQESIERFRRTITHLTDVSQLQAEFAQPAETVSLAAIIEDVRQDLHFQFLESRAVLDVAVNGVQPRVFSPKNLRSLIYNLLSNALKYRHPERVPRVRIRCQPVGDALVLTVQDNGLGLNETQQQRLFQLFQRLHTHVEGSGVGLYTVKKIVDNAGGTITVVSQQGVGTAFTLTFPA